MPPQPSALRFLIVALGLALSLLLAHAGLVAGPDAFWDDGLTHHLWAEEWVGSAAQAREALVGAGLVLLPLAVFVLRLALFRAPTEPGPSAVASRFFSGGLWMLAWWACLAAAWMSLSMDAPRADPGIPPVHGPYASRAWLFILPLPFLGGLALASLLAIWRHRRDTPPVALTVRPRSSTLALLTGLFYGCFLFFWGHTWSRAPVVNTDTVQVLAVERVPKRHKASLRERVHVWVTPWAGQRGPQRLRLLSPDLMDTVEPGTTLDLEWVAVSPRPALRRLRVQADAPPPSAWPLEGLAVRGDWLLETQELRLREGPPRLNLWRFTHDLQAPVALDLNWNGLHDGGVVLDFDPDALSAWVFIARPARNDRYWIRLERGQWQEPVCQERMAFSVHRPYPPERIQVTVWEETAYATVLGQTLTPCPEVRIRRRSWGLYLDGVQANWAARVTGLTARALASSAHPDRRENLGP